MMLLYTSESHNECLSALVSQIMNTDVVGNKKLLNVGAAFDTETSSFTSGYDSDKCAVVYCWMFGIGDEVIYGRDLDGFKELIINLNSYLLYKKATLIVYIHNMKYDFQFIKKYFCWETVFSKSRRDILYARLSNIEFRDSLVLAGGRSLAKIGKELEDKRYQKAVGDLDYKLIRHSSTPLTGEELNYCEMDIRVLIQYINEKIKSDGGIHKIPYTNTGYVRRYVRDRCFENREHYNYLMDGLTMTPGCYLQAETAFMGGAVGPNLKIIGQTLHGVTSYDIKSSYPYAMCVGQFPMSYGIPVKNKDAKEQLKNRSYCYLFTLEIFGLTPKPGNDFCFPLSESKCLDVVGQRVSYGSIDYEEPFSIYRVGSGRVITAMYVRTVCTDLDLETYSKFYDLDNCEWRISEMRKFKKGYLPVAIVRSVVDFFNSKTTLDGVKGKEVDYMISKNMLNSIYGMMVEKPVRPDFGYDNGIIFKSEADYVSKVEEYNNKYNRFLFYPWGVWVTAIARWRLYDAIAEVGSDFIYCDTDSVKFINPDKHQNYFDRINYNAQKEMKCCADRIGYPESMVLPKSPNGDEKCLGVWEYEWTADEFKTLGAKRYLLRIGDEYQLTVAGSNKQGTLEYLVKNGEDPFPKFNSNLVVPPEYSKRLVATFIEDERSGWVTDYLGNKSYFYAPSSIHMEPSAYSFSIAERTKEAVEWLITEGKEEEGPMD